MFLIKKMLSIFVALKETSKITGQVQSELLMK